jgi:hypothetical protein
MSAGELILENGLLKMDWAPVPLQAAPMSNSGDEAVVIFGPTLWRLQVETRRLSMAEARAWSAWLNRRQGRAYSFTAWRLFRYAPASGVLGSPDGSLTVSVDVGARTVTLSGVGGYQARVGDMISYRTAGNGWWAGEVQADVNASGGSITLPVLPAPVAPHALTPAVRRVQALAEFKLATVPEPIEDYTDRRLSFEAMQVYPR